MLTEYIAAALRRATYKLLEDGAYFGEAPDLPGAWASASTLEECREQLREVVEDWIMVGLRNRTPIPTIDGIALDVRELSA